MTDGKSKAMCFFSPLRNCGAGSATQKRLEEQLCHHLGFPRVVGFDMNFVSHIDVEVRFLTDKYILVNDYSALDNKISLQAFQGKKLQAKLRSCFPDLVQVPLPFLGHSQRGITDLDYKTHDQMMIYKPSVNYVQSVVTPHAVYVPTYDNAKLDKLAVQKIRDAVKATGVSREVIPVAVGDLSHHGGGLHCATSQLTGKVAFNFLQRFTVVFVCVSCIMEVLVVATAVTIYLFLVLFTLILFNCKACVVLFYGFTYL